MKKLVAIISGLMLAGVVHAQDKIELTATQMDQVTAGFAAASAAQAGSVVAFGLFNFGGSVGASATNTIDLPGFTQATAIATNTSGALTIIGGNTSASGAQASALVVD